MLPRALVAATLMLSCLLGLGCQSGRTAPDSPGNWAAMAPVQHPTADYLTIEELEQRAGFKLVLPSYLPYGMMSYVATWEDHSPGDDQLYRATVVVPHNPFTTGLLQIEITEWPIIPHESQQPEGEPTPVEQATIIGETTVRCRPEPQYYFQTPPPTPIVLGPSIVVGPPEGELQPELVCHWDSNGLYLVVSFSWTLSESIPGLITSEMREEAMKVVASMIEEPYRP